MTRRLTLHPHSYPGTLITFCGIDGSGKTSMISATAEYVESKGHSCFRTYTPTQRIRKNPLFRSLVDAMNSEERGRVDVMGMCLQVVGDLLQHIRDTIVPRLEAGDVVLCDRYVFTSQAEVQARSGDDEIDQVLAHIARRMPRPDLAFALDIPHEIADHRVRQREDERDNPRDPEFGAKQAAAYHAVARANDLIIVSTERDAEVSFAQIRARVDACLEERSR